MSATISKPSARTNEVADTKSRSPGRSPSSPPTTPASKPISPASAGTNGHAPASRTTGSIDGSQERGLAGLVHANDAHGRSDDEVTTLVLDALSLTADTREVLFVAVRMYVNSVRRRIVKRVETSVMRTFVPGDGTLPASLPTVAPMTIEELQRFCRADLELRVPGESAPIPFQYVTVDQWKAKIAALREKVRADLETVVLYERILDTLVAQSVDSIDEAVGSRNGHR